MRFDRVVVCCAGAARYVGHVRCVCMHTQNTHFPISFANTVERDYLIKFQLNQMFASVLSNSN